MAIARGELWRAIGYLGDIRVSMLRLHRIRTGVFRSGIATDPPAGRFELEVPNSDEFRFTLCSHELHSVVDSLLQVIDWTADYVSSVDNPDSFEAVRRTIYRTRDEIQVYT
jgi:hypothetical protein